MAAYKAMSPLKAGDSDETIRAYLRNNDELNRAMNPGAIQQYGTGKKGDAGYDEQQAAGFEGQVASVKSRLGPAAAPPTAAATPAAAVGQPAAPPSAMASLTAPAPTPDPVTPAAPPAMSSLMGNEPPPPDPGMDVAMSGPPGLRPNLGLRHPPQYNYALASLGRGVY